MLRSALALLSTLQSGARIKQAFERVLRQAFIIAVAAVLLIAATVFGLFAAYRALVSIYSPLAAAGIMAACLLLVGLIVLAMMPLMGRQTKRASPALPVATGDGAGPIDQGLGKAIQQVSPVPIIAIAFLAGLLMSRR
jgi:hypothetical protein